MNTAYASLETRFHRLSLIEAASGILGWDSATMLPEGAAEERGEQLATLSELAHAELTHPALADLLAEAEAKRNTLNDWQQANLREMRRAWQHANAVEASLVIALVRAGSACEHFWREARGRNDFAGFAPKLAEVLSLVREKAAAKSQALGLTPYDALLDQYEPGLTSAAIDQLFAPLATFLPEFIPAVVERQARETAPVELSGPFPIPAQKAVGERFMRALGFDFAHGRLDVSHHPFCGGAPGDVRLTTRYREDNFTESWFGVLHETGHALYELGLPHEWRHQPVGLARGMAVHESQSLFVEMQLACGRDFLHFAAPILREAFASALEAEELYRSVTRVNPNFIRVTADEVTYPCHILLRYELEKSLLDGTLAVADLPEAWNAGMQRLLSITPPDHAQGCMQDIHWTDGSIGYFPTYTLGAMLAAQLMASARAALPELSAQIRRGEFAPLMRWLGQAVHQHGSRYTMPELVANATGEALNPAHYLQHLRTRYGA